MYSTNVNLTDIETEGAEDPWEKVEWGRKLQHYPTVEEFVTFPGMLAYASLALHADACMHCSSGALPAEEV